MLILWEVFLDVCVTFTTVEFPKEKEFLSLLWDQNGANEMASTKKFSRLLLS